VDTESRALPASEAGRRLRAATARLASRLERGRAFKKIDSTMRGPVGAELEGLLEAGGWSGGALLCPAFPAQGRIVRDGRLWVNGALAHESPVGRDRHYPGATSELVAMLEPALTRPVKRLLLADVRAGADAVGKQLATARGAVLAADAESDADLDVLARAAARRADLLVAGSAGLGRAFAAALDFPAPRASLPRPGAWLWVVGSRHPASHAQARALEAAGVLGVWLDAGRSSDLAAVWRALRAGRAAFLAFAAAPGLEPQTVAATLGRAVAGVLAETAVDLLAVTGGETAFATIAALGAALGTPRLDLAGAPASGLALGTLTLGAGSAARRVPFLSKAGGFGAPDLFLTLLGGAAS
jgi:uncharacterized protein YgbK (DUF1537 family)